MKPLLAGIPEADWLESPASVRALINAQQQQIELLRGQLTSLATELENLRERIGRSSRNSSKPLSSDGLGFIRQSGARAVAASGMESRAIPAVGRNCCRSSGWMKWWITTLMPAAAAVSCWTVLIQIPCAIR